MSRTRKRDDKSNRKAEKKGTGPAAADKTQTTLNFESHRTERKEQRHQVKKESQPDNHRKSKKKTQSSKKRRKRSYSESSVSDPDQRQRRGDREELGAARGQRQKSVRVQAAQQAKASQDAAEVVQPSQPATSSKPKPKASPQNPSSRQVEVAYALFQVIRKGSVEDNLEDLEGRMTHANHDFVATVKNAQICNSSDNLFHAIEVHLAKTAKKETIDLARNFNAQRLALLVACHEGGQEWTFANAVTKGKDLQTIQAIAQVLHSDVYVFGGHEHFKSYHRVQFGQGSKKEDSCKHTLRILVHKNLEAPQNKQLIFGLYMKTGEFVDRNDMSLENFISSESMDGLLSGLIYKTKYVPRPQEHVEFIKIPAWLKRLNLELLRFIVLPVCLHILYCLQSLLLIDYLRTFNGRLFFSSKAGNEHMNLAFTDLFDSTKNSHILRQLDDTVEAAQVVHRYPDGVKKSLVQQLSKYCDRNDMQGFYHQLQSKPFGLAAEIMTVAVQRQFNGSSGLEVQIFRQSQIRVNYADFCHEFEKLSWRNYKQVSSDCQGQIMFHALKNLTSNIKMEVSSSNDPLQKAAWHQIVQQLNQDGKQLASISDNEGKEMFCVSALQRLLHLSPLYKSTDKSDLSNYNIESRETSTSPASQAVDYNDFCRAVRAKCFSDRSCHYLMTPCPFEKDAALQVKELKFYPEIRYSYRKSIRSQAVLVTFLTHPQYNKSQKTGETYHFQLFNQANAPINQLFRFHVQSKYGQFNTEVDEKLSRRESLENMLAPFLTNVKFCQLLDDATIQQDISVPLSLEDIPELYTEKHHYEELDSTQVPFKLSERAKLIFDGLQPEMTDMPLHGHAADIQSRLELQLSESKLPFVLSANTHILFLASEYLSERSLTDLHALRNTEGVEEMLMALNQVFHLVFSDDQFINQYAYLSHIFSSYLRCFEVQSMGMAHCLDMLRSIFKKGQVTAVHLCGVPQALTVNDKQTCVGFVALHHLFTIPCHFGPNAGELLQAIARALYKEFLKQKRTILDLLRHRFLLIVVARQFREQFSFQTMQANRYACVQVLIDKEQDHFELVKFGKGMGDRSLIEILNLSNREDLIQVMSTRNLSPTNISNKPAKSTVEAFKAAAQQYFMSTQSRCHTIDLKKQGISKYIKPILANGDQLMKVKDQKGQLCQEAQKAQTIVSTRIYATEDLSFNQDYTCRNAANVLSTVLPRQLGKYNFTTKPDSLVQLKLEALKQRGCKDEVFKRLLEHDPLGIKEIHLPIVCNLAYQHLVQNTKSHPKPPVFELATWTSPAYLANQLRESLLFNKIWIEEFQNQATRKNALFQTSKPPVKLVKLIFKGRNVDINLVHAKLSFVMDHLAHFNALLDKFYCYVFDVSQHEDDNLEIDKEKHSVLMQLLAILYGSCGSAFGFADRANFEKIYQQCKTLPTQPEKAGFKPTTRCCKTPFAIFREKTNQAHLNFAILLVHHLQLILYVLAVTTNDPFHFLHLVFQLKKVSLQNTPRDSIPTLDFAVESPALKVQKLLCYDQLHRYLQFQYSAHEDALEKLNVSSDTASRLREDCLKVLLAGSLGLPDKLLKDAETEFEEAVMYALITQAKNINMEIKGNLINGQSSDNDCSKILTQIVQKTKGLTLMTYDLKATKQLAKSYDKVKLFVCQHKFPELAGLLDTYCCDN